MPDKKRILITGAAGRIGSSLVDLLKDRYEIRALYHHNIPAEPPVKDFVIADVNSFDQMRGVLGGVDAIVHMAADPSTQATWESVLANNITGTYNLYEAARQAGVKKIIFATTNHVMGMYDRDGEWPIYAKQPVRPDSLYGVSKAFGEALSRHYSDRYGMSIICLRIGWFLQQPHDEIALWMWLSPRDCAQLVWRSIESELPFGVFYAISANSRRHWDITDTVEQLGYRPEDDAERFAAEIEAAGKA